MVSGNDVGNFHSAGAAPRSPEVYKHILTSSHIIAKARCLAFVFNREIDELLANIWAEELFLRFHLNTHSTKRQFHLVPSCSSLDARTHQFKPRSHGRRLDMSKGHRQSLHSQYIIVMAPKFALHQAIKALLPDRISMQQRIECVYEVSESFIKRCFRCFILFCLLIKVDVYLSFLYDEFW